MIDIYFALIFLTGILLQLLAGNFGLFLPVTVLLIFYAATATGLFRGIVYSLIFGIIIDVFSGWGFPWHTFACLGAALFARFWCARQMLRPALINFFPGMIAASLPLLVLLPQTIISGDWRFLLDTWLPQFVFGLIAGAILLPVTVALLDHISERLKLPRYQDARKQLEPGDNKWHR
jgi:cell shape-determining protein MreD